MRQDLFAQLRVRVDEHRIAHVVSIEVGLNVPLRVQQKTVNAVVRGKVSDIVRYHPIQPAYAIAAGEPDFGPRTQVVDSTAREQGAELVTDA